MNTASDEVIDIIRAEYCGEYRIRLTFSDGCVRTIDFEPFLRKARNPMTTKYLDVQAFQSFSLELGDLQWNDFEMCFQLNTLYDGTI